MLNQAKLENGSLKHPSTLYIGSICVEGDDSKRVILAAVQFVLGHAARLAGQDTAIEDIRQRQALAEIHVPQTPQLGPEFSMNPESVLHFPFLQLDRSGRLIYDLEISPDKDDDHPGTIKAVEAKRQDEIDFLDLKIAELKLAMEAGSQEQIDTISDELLKKYPELAWMPPEMEALLTALEKELVDQDSTEPLFIKMQAAGPINTAIEIYTYYKDHLKKSHTVLRNKQMLNIHSGLILTRSINWTRKVKRRLGEVTNRPIKFIFSFDEPCFEYMNHDKVGPRQETVKYAYQEVWNYPKALPYKRMIHVCSGLWTEVIDAVLPHVDYFNFDAWKNADQLRGKAAALREFLMRGGVLVAGIVPTNLTSLIDFLQTIDPEADLPFLLESQKLMGNLLNECVNRIEKMIQVLVADGVTDDQEFTEDQLRQQIVISPQCGFGGLVADKENSRKNIITYVDLAYAMTKDVAERIQNL
ncbi:MAG: hypothetical protein PVJ09_01935 [Candidatus Woesebacteria bacterium]|jgi:hypothetical protein